MTSVSIRYFASLREQAGKTHENIETRTLTTGELYRVLGEQYGFSLSPDQVKVAVNEEYRSMDHVLAAGDEIVFIPPVSGG